MKIQSEGEKMRNNASGQQGENERQYVKNKSEHEHRRQNIG